MLVDGISNKIKDSFQCYEYCSMSGMSHMFSTHTRHIAAEKRVNDARVNDPKRLA